MLTSLVSGKGLPFAFAPGRFTQIDWLGESGDLATRANVALVPPQFALLLIFNSFRLKHRAARLGSGFGVGAGTI